MSPSTTFALALEQMDGVGRVTASRLLKSFSDYDDLRRYPREQVFLRIKGVPRGEALMGRLFDEDAMQERLATARQRAEQLEKKHVHLLTPRADDWPAGLGDLSAEERPFLLYAYGAVHALAYGLVALFAHPPLSEAPFEAAQALVRRLLQRKLRPMTGAAHGFDVVVHKLARGASAPSVLVAHVGLTKIPRPLRPVAGAAVRTGGLLLSPFPMTHGPYDHDDAHRALVMAALADACVFVEPRPDTPEWKALTWALDAGRPAFAWPAPDAPLPDGTASLEGEADVERVLTSMNGRKEERKKGGENR